MESHEHKRQLEAIQARRIAWLRYQLAKNPENILLKQHLDRIDKQQ
jgi:hypothetical protein